MDTEAGRIIPDGEIKHEISHQRNYRAWVEENRVTLRSIPLKDPVAVVRVFPDMRKEASSVLGRELFMG